MISSYRRFPAVSGHRVQSWRRSWRNADAQTDGTQRKRRENACKIKACEQRRAAQREERRGGRWVVLLFFFCCCYKHETRKKSRYVSKTLLDILMINKPFWVYLQLIVLEWYCYRLWPLSLFCLLRKNNDFEVSLKNILWQFSVIVSVFFLNNADMSVIFTYIYIICYILKWKRKCRERWATGKKNVYI